MSIPIVHGTTFMTHESGTKFYEVVRLHIPDIKQHLVIKRWGKIAAKVAGGEIQFQVHPNGRKAEAATDTIIRSKTNRGYSIQLASFGLHSYGGELNSDNVRSFLMTHYGPTNARAILREFKGELGATYGGVEADGVIIDEAADIISEEPAPEPERGESWGSW